MGLPQLYRELRSKYGQDELVLISVFGQDEDDVYEAETIPPTSPS